MNNEQKSREQLLEELARERELVERERERSLALQEVSKKVASAHDTEEILDLIVNEAARLLRTSAAFLRLLEDDVLVPSAATESAAHFLTDSVEALRNLAVEEEASAMGHVMATKKPLVLANGSEEELLTPAGGLIMRRYGFQGWAGVPLLADNRSLGVLIVLDNTIRRFTEDEVSLLTAFADQAALALEKARLLEEAETERERSDSLYRVSNMLAGAHDTDEVLDLIVNEAARLVDATGAYIRLLEGEGLVPSAYTASTRAYLADVGEANPSFQAEEGTSIIGHVMATRKPRAFEDVTLDSLVTPLGRINNQKHGFHGGAAIPLLANGLAIGVLGVLDKRIRLFTDNEVSLLTAFADQAALALEKARLLNDAVREKERSDALYRVSNLLAGAHNTDEVLDLIVNEVARLLGAPSAYIRLLEGESLVRRASVKSTGSTVRVLAVGEGVMGHVMASKKPWTTENTAEEELLSAVLRSEAQADGIVSAAVVPLIANDRSIGVLSVMEPRIRRFTEDEVSLLTAFADQASLALEKARLLNEAETERERAETERERADSLYRVSNLLAGVHDTDEVLDLIVNEAARLLGAPGAYIRLLEGDLLVPRAATQSAADLFAGLVDLAVGEGMMGRVMATQKPLTSDDVAENELAHPEDRLKMKQHGFRGAAVVPLLADGLSIGGLGVMDTRIRNFTDNEVSLLSAFADQAALALEKARLLNEAEARERQATQIYDVTTQLASNHDLDSVLDLITEQAAALMDGASGILWQFDEFKGGLTAVNTFNALPELLDVVILPGEGIAGQAYAARRVAWTSNYLTMLDDPSFAYSSPALNDAARKQVTEDGITSILSAPIVITDRVWGVLTVQFDGAREFTDEDFKLVQNLADSAAVAINNARFIAETEHARDEATQLQEVTAQLASTTDMNAVLELITGKAKELLHSDTSAIWRYDEAQGGLVVPAWSGVGSSEIADSVIPLGFFSAGRAYAERRPIWIQDYLVEESVAPTPADREWALHFAESHGLRSGMSVPVIIRDEVYGVLTINYFEPHDYTERERPSFFRP